MGLTLTEKILRAHIVYGEPVTASAYSLAKALEGNEELSEEAAAFVEKVISCFILILFSLHPFLYRDVQF